MKLDVLIRVAGSVRSPVEQIEALLQEIGPDVTVLVTEPFAAGEYTQLSEADSLEEILEGPRAERVLIYGDEHLLPHVKKLELETVWMAVGPGANPLRNVWRLRGAHPWLGSARLALLLEDETAGKGLANSPTLTTGRISRIVTMPSATLATAEPEAAVLELVAASAMPPEVEEAPAPEAEPAPEAHDGEEEVLLGETQPVEGAEEPMYTTTGIVSEGAR
ncbi:MAG TPA: hypothetical protein VNT75_24020, partial [Symbiobacteriaceae bacterium]|nr:hypothetical protein [Symbiobacteriaceae bacterium]